MSVFYLFGHFFDPLIRYVIATTAVITKTIPIKNPAKSHPKMNMNTIQHTSIHNPQSRQPKLLLIVPASFSVSDILGSSIFIVLVLVQLYMQY